MIAKVSEAAWKCIEQSSARCFEMETADEWFNEVRVYPGFNGYKMDTADEWFN